MLSKSNKTDLRILRTRRLIEEAFKELMENKGIDDVTVRDIATKAMINRATFYAHFADKYELFGFIVRDSFRDFLDEILKGLPLFSEGNMAILITAIFDYMGTLNTTCHKHPRAKYSPIVEAQVQSQLYDMILEWIGNESPAELSEKPEINASILSWMIFGSSLQWNQNGSPALKQEVVAEVAKMIFQRYPELERERPYAGKFKQLAAK